MEFLDLDFIPKKLPIQYKFCKKEIATDDLIFLFDKYPAKTTLSKTILGKIDITFEFENFDALEEINNLLFQENGEPQYIQSEGTYTWKLGKIFLSHGEKEIYYQHGVHFLNISFAKPFWGIEYSYYKEHNLFMKRCISVWNLQKVTNFIDFAGKIHYFYQTKNFRYIFDLNKHKIEMAAHEINKTDKPIKELVHWKEKKRFKELSELDVIINSFLSYLEEYDSDLHQIH